MSITGERTGKPVRAGASIADIASGIEAAYGTVCMLLHRELTGEGNHLDVAMLDTMFAVMNKPVSQYLNSGTQAQRIGNEHPQDTPWDDFPTQDGSIVIACGRTNAYLKLCEAFGIPEMGTDPRYCNDDVRLQHKLECHAMVREYTKKYTTKELLDLLNEYGVPCAPINDTAMACQDESLIARGMIATVTHKTAGTYQLPGTPLKLTKNPIQITKGSPILGENNREIFGGLGMSKEEIDALLTKQAKVRTFYKEYEME